MSRPDFNRMQVYTCEIHAPSEKNVSIEELEVYLNDVSKLAQFTTSLGGYASGVSKNTPIQSEKQIQMRIRLRKKLEKNKSKSKKK